MSCNFSWNCGVGIEAGNSESWHRSARNQGGTVVKWVVFVELYCDLLAKRTSAMYAANAQRVLDRFTNYRDLHSRLVSEITPLDLELYVSQRQSDKYRGQPLSNRTINNEIQTLDTAFTKAGPRGFDRKSRRNFAYTDSPPTVDLLPVLVTDNVAVTKQQIRAWLIAMRVCGSPSYDVDRVLFWDCVAVLLYVIAVRRGALLNLPRPTTEQIDQCILFLPARFNKEREDIYWRVGRSVMDMLVQLPSDPGESLLPWKKANGKRMSANYFSHCILAAQRAAGISDTDRIRAKDLRSTVATIVADEFGDATAKKRLGHSASTNTINTHYKSRRPTETDLDASRFLSKQAFSFLE